MYIATLCTDVVTIIIKQAVVSCKKNVAEAVRVCKTLRSIDKTFKQAFDDNKQGCRTIRRHVKAVLKYNNRRIVVLRRLMKLHAIRVPDTTEMRAVFKWTILLERTLKHDTDILKNFLCALNYVLEGNIGKIIIYYRQSMPSYHLDHISKIGNGLPKGIWKLTPSQMSNPPLRIVDWIVFVLLLTTNTFTDEQREQITFHILKYALHLQTETDSSSSLPELSIDHPLYI